MLGGCQTVRATHPAPDEVESAIDHVEDVLGEAGHATPGIVGLVAYDCGPTDAVLGIRVTDMPVTVGAPWADVAPAAALRGRDLPAPSEDPLAGAPASVDQVEVVGDDWVVRWGTSNATSVDGVPATVVTVVRGGEVSGEALRRWVDAGLLAEVYPCG